MIKSKTGSSPPFRYAAAQATMDAEGVWTQAGGGAAYNKRGTGVPARQSACATAFKPWILRPEGLVLLKNSGTRRDSRAYFPVNSVSTGIFSCSREATWTSHTSCARQS